MLIHLLPAGRSRVGSRHGGRAGGRIAWAAAKRARAGWLQIVAALLSDPEVAALLLGGDGRGVSARDARAAVEDALGGKSSISKRDLAEAMAQRAREEASPSRGQYSSPSVAERTRAARAAEEAKDRAARAFERMDKRGAGELSKEEVGPSAGAGWSVGMVLGAEHVARVRFGQGFCASMLGGRGWVLSHRRDGIASEAASA